MKKNLIVSAGCLINEHGEILLVRKRGTTMFMQPGGKPEAGETPLDTVVREIQEELGVVFAPAEFEYMGEWRGPAANEAGATLHAYLYGASYNGHPQPLAELEELMWISPTAAAQRNDIAPLLREHVLPQLISSM